MRIYYVYSQIQVQAKTQTQSSIGQEEKLEGVIVKYPKLDRDKQYLYLNDVKIITSRYPNYKLGDYIIVNNQNKNVSNSLNKNIYYPDIATSQEESNIYLNFIDKFRNYLVIRIQRALHEPYATFILGMTIGYDNDIPDYYTDKLRDTGLIHVLVVSGYNVSLVLSGVYFVLIKFGKKAFMIGSITFILFFLLIVGLEPPVIRAVIMGIIGVFARVQGDFSDSIYTLFLSIVIMLFLYPVFLSDISFQLSIVATTAVIIGSSIASRSNWLVKEIVIVTMVNIAIIPIVSYYFESIVLVGIAANLLVSWLVPIITISGILAIMLPILPLKLVVIAAVNAFNSISDLFYNSNFTSIHYKISIPSIFIYYIVMIMIIKWVYATISYDQNTKENFSN